jgi:hypothetical protein
VKTDGGKALIEAIDIELAGKLRTPKFGGKGAKKTGMRANGMRKDVSSLKIETEKLESGVVNASSAKIGFRKERRIVFKEFTRKKKRI